MKTWIVILCAVAVAGAVVYWLVAGNRGGGAFNRGGNRGNRGGNPGGTGARNPAKQV